MLLNNNSETKKMFNKDDKFYKEMYAAVYDSIGSFNYENAAFLAEILVQEDESWDSRRLLGECYIHLGEYAKCYYLLVNTDDPHCRYYLALSCYKLKKYNDARNSLINCIDRLPNISHGYYLLAQIEEKLDNQPAALNYYKIALEKNYTLFTAYDKILKLEDLNNLKSFKEYDNNNKRFMFNKETELNSYSKTLFPKSETNNNNSNTLRISTANKEVYKKVSSTNSKNNKIMSPIKASINSKINSVQQKKSAKKNEKQSHLLKILRTYAKILFYEKTYQLKKFTTLTANLPVQIKSHVFILISKIKVLLGASKILELSQIFKEIHSVFKLHYIDLYSSVLYLLQSKEELSMFVLSIKDICFDMPEFWVCMGNLYSIMVDYPSAIEFFKRATQIRKDYSYAHSLYALELINLENFSEAEDSYKIALKEDPKMFTCLWGMGNIFQRKGEFMLARHFYDKAITLNSENYMLYFYLAQCCFENGDYNNALNNYITADKLSPDNPEILYNISNIFIKQNKLDNAKEILELLISKNPKDYNYYFSLATIYKKKLMMSEAKYYFDLCLDLSPPNSQEIREIITLISEKSGKRQIFEFVDEY